MRKATVRRPLIIGIAAGVAVLLVVAGSHSSFAHARALAAAQTAPVQVPGSAVPAATAITTTVRVTVTAPNGVMTGSEENAAATGTMQAGTPAEAGAQIFAQNCAQCHTLDRQRKQGPGLAGLYSFEALPRRTPVTDADLAEFIQRGGLGMPAFPGIQGEQMDALLTYLKQETTNAAQSPLGPPRPGTEVYAESCAGCHMVTSLPTQQGPGLAGIFRKPLLPDSIPMTPEGLALWIHTGGGGMPAFPQIQGQEMDNLIQFLREATMSPRERRAQQSPTQ